MTTIDTLIVTASAILFIILIILMVRDKNKPIGYRFTNPEDHESEPLDNDEENDLDKK